ncbi:DNA-binding transcriptional regulator, MarR family [Aliiroseovarius halocynthiae]|uniref:Winged helix-turn-helix transcriptional regulator n=1 Tax=Aliiroseovarius halocynthiae TaxID=985055 RepID=A0A545SQ86_9RHOB|nr:MarR family winged helix-turn-helix transcriptional regulator [Aliiroseovarius halocynthiae]TQV67124.1 winged helix-turn-helix transcriptional regulator [Aliiroseovarius halocynthiae]SMR82148.1 DNA-binding transcriptional regulator, MarR family [Aliiroseovarius halocynthiae]
MDKKPNDQTTAIWVLLNIAHKRVTQTFEAELKRARLPSAAWYDILWALERAKDGMRQNQLESQSLFDQPNLSRTIKRMVDDGLVTQCPAPSDRRGRVLRITDDGKALRAQMWEVYGRLMLSQIEDKVPDAHISGLIEGLASLIPEKDEKLQGKLNSARDGAEN